jgi:hypothetical protein
MLSVIYAECHLCSVSFMVGVIYAGVIYVLSITNTPFMQIVVNAECRL